ncbi:MAG: sulfotransferase domain-containing protein [Xanthomonadales bacterium]|nr:sulfotransferase domain-containing protein [Xanthomonadales bacterium]
MKGLPQFLIIGVQKAGTSWLHRNLREHPGLFLPKTKDLGYFCWCEGEQALTLEQYRQEFARSAPGQLAGEATAAYFWTESGSQWDVKPTGYCQDLPKRVRETLGDNTRLVLSLRDPVERAVSAFIHHIALGDLDPESSLLDAGDFSGIIDIGFYAVHLQNWLRYFPLRQFLLLDFERDITLQPAATLRRVFGFLGVESSLQIPGCEKPVFEGRARRWVDGEVWVPLDQYPQAPPSEQNEIDGGTWCRRVDRSTVDDLRDIYAADQNQLKGLLG